MTDQTCFSTSNTSSQVRLCIIYSFDYIKPQFTRYLLEPNQLIRVVEKKKCIYTYKSVGSN